jgi:hypothetical protein
MTQIARAGRTATKGVVAFDVGWEGDLSRHESVLWSMLITSPDGRETVQLGYQVFHGAFSAQFVRDQVSGRQEDLEQDADLRDDEITVRFPAERVGVAAGWPSWRAVITVDGDDVAEKLVALG